MNFSARKTLKAISLLTALTIGFSAVPAAAAEEKMLKLIEDIEPKVSFSAVTGSKKIVRVLAHEDADVTVKVGSKTITLSATGDYTDKDSVWYEGSYTVPSSAADGEALGRITATATLGGKTETRKGGSITAVKMDRLKESEIVLPEVDDEDDETVYDGDMLTVKNPKKFSGEQVTVTDIYADVFIDDENDRGEDYAAPYYYQLPKGTVDYVLEEPNLKDKDEDNDLYVLASGRKVKPDDVKVSAKSGSMGQNQIGLIELDADSECTYLTIDNEWNVPFNIEVDNVRYGTSVSNTVASYSPKKIRITFDYTAGITAEEIDIPRKSCFKSAKVSTQVSELGIPQCVLELTLRDPVYYGAYAEYGRNGKLELKFYNPIDSLDGARIVLDSGHGSYKTSTQLDPGTEGASGNWEYIENWKKANALKDELEARGAEVYLMDTYKTKDLYDLYDRVDEATAWEPMVFVSLHHNSSSNKQARGVEVYYNNPWSVYLAKNVADNVFAAYKTMDNPTGAVNRGHKFSEYAVTRTKQFAAILIEYGFMTTSLENKILSDERNVLTFAEYTADGIEAYFENW